MKTYVNITEGNALRIDWNEVVPVERLSYIMGNPPFVGYSYQSESQKKDIENVYVDEMENQLQRQVKSTMLRHGILRLQNDGGFRG